MQRFLMVCWCGVLLLTPGRGPLAADSLGRPNAEQRYAKAFAEIEAAQQRTLRHLPEWLRPHYKHGLLAEVDDAGNVVSLTVSGIMTDDLLARLPSLLKLRELHIECTSNISPAGLAHLARLTELEKLSVFEVNVGGAGLGDEILRNSLKIATLRDLSVSECGLTDAGARFLEQMPQLSRLTLSHEGRLTDAALNSVAKLKRLQGLHLPSYVSTESHGRMRFSANGLMQLTALTELEELGLAGHAPPAEFFVFPKLTHLSVGGINDAAAAQIARCHDLERLELMYSLISDEGLRQIAALANLRQLDLNSTVITDAGIEHFKQSASLKHVSLRAPIRDASLMHLSEIGTLERLDLSGSALPESQMGMNFTMEGLQHLKRLPNLRTLYLYNLRLEGGFSGLAKLRQLRALSLRMTNMQEDEFYRLEESMPETIISPGLGKLLPKQVRAISSVPEAD
jgi:hypothetical protein